LGVPLDPVTLSGFEALVAQYGLEAPWS
jgi:hypothetical protein